jgi:hypothetical protein
MMDPREQLWIAALPGDGWTIEPVAGLFIIATNADRRSYMIWNDGTIQPLRKPPRTK